jgi:hypothetical protein
MLITDYYFIIRNHIIMALTFGIDLHILFDLGDRKFILEALAFCFSEVPKCLVLQSVTFSPDDRILAVLLNCWSKFPFFPLCRK